MSKHKLKGSRHSISEMNLSFYGSMDPDFPMPRSEEERQAFQKLWEACKPKPTGKVFGVPIIYGTGGAVDNNFDFKKLWNDENI